MSTCDMADPLFLSHVVQSAKLIELSIHVCSTSIWLYGLDPDGNQRQISLELFRTSPDTIKLSGALIVDDEAKYTSIEWEHLTDMTLGQLVMLSKLLVDALVDGYGTNINRLD